MIEWIKPISPLGMEFEHEVFLLGSHAAAFETGVEVINPTQPATLSCSIKTYNIKPTQVKPVSSSTSPMAYHPPPRKPDTFAKRSQRRSPNKPTNHTSWRSSCSVQGPFLVSPFAITIASTCPLSLCNAYQSSSSLLQSQSQSHSMMQSIWLDGLCAHSSPFMRTNNRAR